MTKKLVFTTIIILILTAGVLIYYGIYQLIHPKINPDELAVIHKNALKLQEILNKVNHQDTSVFHGGFYFNIVKRGDSYEISMESRRTESDSAFKSNFFSRLCLKGRNKFIEIIRVLADNNINGALFNFNPDYYSFQYKSEGSDLGFENHLIRKDFLKYFEQGPQFGPVKILDSCNNYILGKYTWLEV